MGQDFPSGKGTGNNQRDTDFWDIVFGMEDIVKHARSARCGRLNASENIAY
jgi:hypothetical protein